MLCFDEVLNLAAEYPVLFVVTIIGSLPFLKIICKALYWIYKIKIRPRKNLFKRYSGGWAVITGASEGMGKGFAEELAKEGFNIAIIARRENILHEVSQQITQRFKVKVIHIPFDFNVEFSEENYESLIKEISKLDISILVNNVGTAQRSQFHKYKLEDIGKLMKVNVHAMTYLTRRILPQMLERKKRGAVISLSSIVNESDWPYISMYASTKAYIRSFSNSLHHEFKSKNIDFLCVTMGGVVTSLHPRKQPGDIDIATSVNSILDCLGYESEICGNWRHEVQNRVLNSSYTYKKKMKVIKKSIEID